jgi:hypothetical protein
MKSDEQKSANTEIFETDAEAKQSLKRKNNGSLDIFNHFFNLHKNKIITIGNIALFFISIFVGSFSGDGIPLLLRVRTAVIIALVVFACLSPIFIMHTVKGLRGFITDKESEDEKTKLIEKLGELSNKFETASARLDKSIGQNEDYFKVAISHIDNCPSANNIIRKSYMINDISEYYQHLTNARMKANNKNIYVSNFSTKPYESDNKAREEYFKNDIDFIRDNECHVYRIVTVHSYEKLLFLKELFDDAVNSKSDKYSLAYLDIEKFSDDKLPDIVGMDIIGNEVIMMDFKYARALREYGYNEPLYIESEELADIFREYYEKIWTDISISSNKDENTTNKRNRRYKGYILYNGLLGCIHKDIDEIWKELESKYPEKNKSSAEALSA